MADVKLYAWQPPVPSNEASWFVMAESHEQAEAAVQAEIDRRMALPSSDPWYLEDWECGGPSSDGCTLTIAGIGHVITNSNN